MKKLLIFSFAVMMVVACKQAVEPNNSAAMANQQSADKKGDEPTTPEATEIWEPIPPKVAPFAQNGVPSDALVLFDGTNFDEWEMTADSSAVKWTLNPDGSMTVKDKTGNIQTKKAFGSVQLHIEWRSDPENKQEGQNRSNSGVFLQKRYEVQVLDNNDNPTYVNGMVASVYKQSIPMAMASVPSGEWNTYDIIFHAPEFNDDETLAKAATVTVLHNGVLVQDHFEIEGPVEYIGWPEYMAHGKAPLELQDHQDNSGVSYRNIWIRELD
jgi:hypothetical protein